ncbi:hypothetical protein TPHA_0J02270 [Tetrapisispora phaffii CBS 4417]|uniref:Probable endonuclease LCL3 n=1 Tax=Tetrapisispora phaffii (strain ATCC 24235 / CBS 4417 / NBRC 1672 / NRRL Y-8282 / UCD 70-5) TaxID=1071381 RepID=G8BYV5_TETPH|nr:hypothetical protein TPHA_0J02270 [Tetrapisispora phaffii CBS 4417]CCE65047.1 hypothetical protein TPHA_0J02270 [Tetrapisispora phaffii CBS 4417]
MSDSSNHKKSSLWNDQKYSVITLSCLISGSTFGAYFCYNRYLRQISKATDIPIGIFRKRWLYGKVTAVGDGDNFHFYHTPGGVLGGWGWIRRVPKSPINDSMNNDKYISTGKKTKSKSVVSPKSFFSRSILNFKKKSYSSNSIMQLKVPYKNLRNLPTIPVRIYAVDAPERAHFGGVTQPFGDEALVWLSYKLLGRYIWMKPLSVDQYNRCVAKVVYWTWLGWRNISLEMIKEGLAVVYEGKTTAEFDGEEMKFRFYERRAKLKKKGLWVQRRVVSPGEYKKSMK